MSTSSASLTDSWRRWVAENKLLKAGDQSMIETLIRNGIPEPIARQEVQAAGNDQRASGH